MMSGETFVRWTKKTVCEIAQRLFSYPEKNPILRRQSRSLNAGHNLSLSVYVCICLLEEKQGDSEPQADSVIAIIIHVLLGCLACWAFQRAAAAIYRPSRLKFREVMEIYSSGNSSCHRRGKKNKSRPWLPPSFLPSSSAPLKSSLYSSIPQSAYITYTAVENIEYRSLSIGTFAT